MAAKKRAAKRKRKAAPKITAATSTQRAAALAADDRVRHSTLGKGSVLDVDGAQARVRFHRPRGRSAVKDVAVSDLERV